MYALEENACGKQCIQTSRTTRTSLLDTGKKSRCWKGKKKGRCWLYWGVTNNYNNVLLLVTCVHLKSKKARTRTVLVLVRLNRSQLISEWIVFNFKKAVGAKLISKLESVNTIPKVRLVSRKKKSTRTRPVNCWKFCTPRSI